MFVLTAQKAHDQHRPSHIVPPTLGASPVGLCGHDRLPLVFVHWLAKLLEIVCCDFGIGLGFERVRLDDELAWGGRQPNLRRKGLAPAGGQ